MSVEARVRRGLRAQADRTDLALPPVDDVFLRARRQRTRAGTAAVAAVLLVIVGVVAAVSAMQATIVEPIGQPQPEVGQPEPEESVPALDPDLLQQHGWRKLPPGPLDDQSDVTMVWTGAEVLLWSAVGSTSGAAYRPETATWRELPDGPLRTGEGHVAVWTGQEMIVWGGTDAPTYAAAYNPVADEWRSTADAPIVSTELPAVVWTGEEMIVWGGTTGGGVLPGEASGAAYDPQTDTWRSLPSAPVPARRQATAVWTGEEMIVWGGQKANNAPVSSGAAYDPATNSWRQLSAAPVTGFYQHSAQWTGDEMLVWGWVHGTTGQQNETAAYDPATDRWRALSPAPLDPPPSSEGVGGQSAVWAGSMLLAWSGTLDDRGPLALAFDPAQDRWVRLAEAPTPAWYHPEVVWTGSSLVVWGGDGDDFGSPPLGGAELRFGRRR